MNESSACCIHGMSYVRGTMMIFLFYIINTLGGLLSFTVAFCVSQVRMPHFLQHSKQYLNQIHHSIFIFSTPAMQRDGWHVYSSTEARWIPSSSFLRKQREPFLPVSMKHFQEILYLGYFFCTALEQRVTVTYKHIFLKRLSPIVKIER